MPGEVRAVQGARGCGGRIAEQRAAALLPALVIESCPRLAASSMTFNMIFTALCNIFIFMSHIRQIRR